ncbi:ABC transporter substrate-binding protein [Paenibacillus xerothermodurans]|uniref:Sugar ABC transporter substrate-binding protein n=1 Tax=Paenibacillus xerothermodurans TaxID=1977292 RepID=A0A2W1NQ49_PAEXE|nr:extracellular solute-binding protein [Paenibacillus xerothermodurans]PZE21615.1 sugar ABC transporter substrate-binding protein [Paenibacillus xerothermodurans]
MIKQLIPAALTVGIAGVMVSGCSGVDNNVQPNNASNVTQINLLSSWSTDTERGRVLQNLIDRYNEQNRDKVRVNVDINPDWPAYQEKVKTMIAANQTPDVFNFNFNPNDLSRQKSGNLLDFTPHLDKTWKSRFKADDLEALTVDNTLTTLPFEKAGVLFYYNKDLFAKAGIQHFPTNWDEFFAVCAKLKDHGITPISLMTADDAWHTTNALTYLAASADGVNVFDVGQSLATPAMVKAAEYLEKLFEYTTEDALGANYAVSSNHFVLGNTAMIIDGPWLIGSLDPQQLNSYGVAPGPTFNDGKAKPGFIVTDTYTPWSAGKQASKEKEQAVVDFMKYLTSEESSKQLTLQGKILLSTKMNLSEEEMNSSGEALGSFIQMGNEAPESLIQIVRVLKPTAIAQLPALLEGLFLQQLSPQEFAHRLDAANK